MDLTEGSETSANINQTLGKHPKVNTVYNRICFRRKKAMQYLSVLPSRTDTHCVILNVTKYLPISGTSKGSRFLNTFSHHVKRILLPSYKNKLPRYINRIVTGLVVRVLGN
jgi:hypothetical protein